MDHLQPGDRFGLVLFDDTSYLAKPLSLVEDTDMKAIKDHVLELEERGGTNMDSGMQEATNMFKELSGADPSVYENRIIFMTDAQPNLGDTSEEGLYGQMKSNADNGVYSTFVGIGVDFNTELVEALTKIRGANYYSVHSAKEFTKVLDTDFDYMVTPLVFDLSLKLDATGWEIEKVYGSPEADEATGEIMKVNTLFPSKTEGGETKGGLVLIKLKKTGESGDIKLKVSYQDRNGKSDSDEKDIVFADKPADFYDNTGIHKGILLTRYANLMQGWAIDSRRGHDKPDVVCPPIIAYEKGLVCPMDRCLPPMPVPCHFELGQWERQSIALNVSEHYKKVFADFAKYFEAEMKAIGDDTLQQELDVLNKLEKE
jgi:Ca-activated chloride channel family protein